MRQRTSAQDGMLARVIVFHWFEKRHMVMWMTGQAKRRHKVTEYNLPRMVKNGLLKEARYGKKKVYTAWASRMHIEHGLVCSEALIRFVVSRSDCTVIGENQFRAQRFGVIPEWAITYPTRKMLLFEYCTKDNAGRSGLVTKKSNLYRRNLAAIERHFRTQAVVLFVLDSKDTVKHALANLENPNFYFVDLDSFLKVKIGRQLSAPIYIWAGDRRRYPLSND